MQLLPRPVEPGPSRPGRVGSYVLKSSSTIVKLLAVAPGPANDIPWDTDSSRETAQPEEAAKSHRGSPIVVVVRRDLQRGRWCTVRHRGASQGDACGADGRVAIAEGGGLIDRSRSYALSAVQSIGTVLPSGRGTAHRAAQSEEQGSQYALAAHDDFYHRCRSTTGRCGPGAGSRTGGLDEYFAAVLEVRVLEGDLVAAPQPVWSRSDEIVVNA